MADQARESLLQILAETRSWLARPGNNFTWSGWDDGDEALCEVDELIGAVRAGKSPKLRLAVLFAPAGPIQDVSVDSGWATEFLVLAGRFDEAIAKIG